MSLTILAGLSSFFALGDALPTDWVGGATATDSIRVAAADRRRQKIIGEQGRLITGCRGDSLDGEIPIPQFAGFVRNFRAPPMCGNREMVAALWFSSYDLSLFVWMSLRFPFIPSRPFWQTIRPHQNWRIGTP
jgi:hypothetical protein